MRHRLGTRRGRAAGSGISRCLLAEALVIGSWTGVVAVLARTAPSAIQCLADELLVRCWCAENWIPQLAPETTGSAEGSSSSSKEEGRRGPDRAARVCWNHPPQPPRWLGARPRFGGASALSPGRQLGDGPMGVAEFLRKLAGREDPAADLLGEARPDSLQGTAHVRMRVQDATR